VRGVKAARAAATRASFIAPSSRPKAASAQSQKAGHAQMRAARTLDASRGRYEIARDARRGREEAQRGKLPPPYVMGMRPKETRTPERRAQMQTQTIARANTIQALRKERRIAGGEKRARAGQASIRAHEKTGRQQGMFDRTTGAPNMRAVRAANLPGKVVTPAKSAETPKEAKGGDMAAKKKVVSKKMAAEKAAKAAKAGAKTPAGGVKKGTKYAVAPTKGAKAAPAKGTKSAAKGAKGAPAKKGTKYPVKKAAGGKPAGGAKGVKMGSRSATGGKGSKPKGGAKGKRAGAKRGGRGSSGGGSN